MYKSELEKLSKDELIQLLLAQNVRQKAPKVNEKPLIVSKVVEPEAEQFPQPTTHKNTIIYKPANVSLASFRADELFLNRQSKSKIKGDLTFAKLFGHRISSIKSKRVLIKIDVEIMTEQDIGTKQE